MRILILLLALVTWTQGRVMTSAERSQLNAAQAKRWQTACISPLRRKEVAAIVDRGIAGWSRYTTVRLSTTVPESVTLAIHNMECGQSWKQHLHNGDSLQRRTWQVPAGRPKKGNPPFTWEESAIDAEFYDGLHKVDWSNGPKSLTALEGYNGLGYFFYHKATPSPYIVGGTSAARPGKYVRDGVWSSTAISSQIGIIAIWKELEARGRLHQASWDL